MISEEKFEELTRKSHNQWTKADIENYNDYCWEMDLVNC